MDDFSRRLDKFEARLEGNDIRYWALKDEISEIRIAIGSLQAFRDNEKAKHSNTPAWLFGTISAAVSVAALLFNLYLAGVRP